MKKTSIALLIGLFAIGCEPAAAPKTTTPPMTAHDPAMMQKMMQHSGPPTGAGAEMKKDEKKAEGDAGAPATPAEPAAPAGEAPK